MVLIGVAWTVAVVRWPRLSLPDDATARGWQSQVTIGLASIIAGLVALLLTVGLAAVQLRASLSWRAMRGIFDVPARVGLLVIVAIGVAFPLWVAMAPTARWSRLAFAAFGWALLLAAAMVWIGMERTAPEWLVDRAIRRAVRAPGRRSIGNKRRTTDRTDVVVELAGHPALGAIERRRALVAAAYLLASQPHSTERARTDAAIGRIARGPIDGSTDPSVTEDTVIVLTVLGVALAHRSSAHYTIRGALTGIGQRARADGHHAIGKEALNGLAEATIARLALLVPPVPCRPASRPLSSQDSRRAVLTHPHRHAATTIITEITQATTGERLERLDVEDIVSAALALGGEDEPKSPNEHQANELLQATTDDLVSILASPRPDAGRWPGGWQGPGELAEDIRRIRALAHSMYEQGQYNGTDTVENALEEIGVALLTDSDPQVSRPPDRTRWRDAHSPDDEDPSAAFGKALADLMVAAFEGGFDRRALITGRRLLAAITMSATSVNISAATNLGRSFQLAILQLTQHQQDRSFAHHVRESRLLGGLISEVDPLITACSADPRLEDLTRSVTGVLAWSTDGNPLPLATELWKARLRTVGWLTEPLHHQRRPGSAEVAPLPAGLVSEAQEQMMSALAHAHQDPSYAAALISSLWAHSAASLRSGDNPDAAEHLHDLLTRWRGELKNGVKVFEDALGERAPGLRAVGKPLNRLIRAAIHWSVEPRRTPAFPRRVPPFAGRLHNMLSDPRFVDLTYRGLRGSATLVLVEEHGGTKRLLRDDESRARGQFEWGYGGTGPTNLAESLAVDVLGDLVPCPACLGGAAFTSKLVHCQECKGTGQAPQLFAVQMSIAEKIDTLPRNRETDQSWSTDWTCTRRELLQQASKNLEP